MKIIIERLLVFFIGIPLVFSVVYFLPHYNHLVLNTIIIVFSGLGAVELSSMLEKKMIRVCKPESFILGALAPLAVTLDISLNLHQWITPAIIMTGAGWALMSKVFSRKIKIENISNHIIACFSLLIYPGFFMCWVIYMSSWGNTLAILLFFFITFGNDSFAWLFGTLFGKNNRGIINISPNKSVAGYIGGILGSIFVAAAGLLIFSPRFPFFPGISISSMVITALIIGLCTGAAAALGDLAESAIKRSCEIKDSGNFMLGRGGVLDSIDSIAVAAPVFFFLFLNLFNV
ncbi:MAG: phosphatidate cytidylyltransferase [Treponema sp.]|nr:phosphatidate cytidylyltransferase [Treponema sp.]